MLCPCHGKSCGTRSGLPPSILAKGELSYMLDFDLIALALKQRTSELTGP